ncbi:MAG: hypothetical protein QF577_09240, partial [Phycisphaerae bacterium]|nr:hypothetical protein [Phycisphaerae bacterium]
TYDDRSSGEIRHSSAFPKISVLNRDFPDEIRRATVVSICDDSTMVSGTVNIFPGSKKRTIARHPS